MASMNFSKSKLRYLLLLGIGFTFSGLFKPLKYLFPDFAAIYSQRTQVSQWCAQVTADALAKGVFPTEIGCQPLTFHLKVVALFTLWGIVLSALYLLVLPTKDTISGASFRVPDFLLLAFVVFFPMLCSGPAIINVLDAFYIGHVRSSPPHVFLHGVEYEPPVAISVALYSILNITYLAFIFFRIGKEAWTQR